VIARGEKSTRQIVGICKAIELNSQTADAESAHERILMLLREEELYHEYHGLMAIRRQSLPHKAEPLT
jgi:hypothetical protein